MLPCWVDQIFEGPYEDIWRYMKYVYGPFFITESAIGNTLETWTNRTGAPIFGACEKRSRDDWRQILVEASCERSVGESVQQVSSCNDCLKIVFAQLKCWSRYIYIHMIYTYIYTCYIYLYYIYMLYPDFMLYIHTACIYIYIICTYTGWCDSQCRQEGVPITVTSNLGVVD